MLRIDKRSALLFLLLGGIFAVLAYAMFASGLVSVFTSKEEFLGFVQRDHRYAVALFIGLQALQVVAAPIPGEISGFVGGLLFGPLWGIVYSTLGLTIGSWLAFMLARLLGRPLVVRVVSAEVLRRYDYVMKHKGMFLAFLMFLTPGFPKDYLCYVLGLGQMGQRAFLLVSVSGRLLGTVLLTMGGVFFRERRYGALFTLVGISLLAVFVVMLYRGRIERSFRRMRAAQRLKSIQILRRERSRSRKI